ncbi:phage antirepressor protein KilAC domain-containing protein [Marinobacter sp. 3-2]|uniref:phage antirepressor KilAC domain-containing protein n=1 Tax=Marinobacter sp. 3-2 TaxID=2485141 RepID=UPI000D334D06|nr:phage antirepressor KilAC domain-containing protein [Marinobacter sp. 3-2]ROQ39350.1 phage antirepressor protein KilAC domain-containing protein [Marinobacter sp. 3-2]
MEYTFDQAAALLNMGRNTLIRRLREEGMLGTDNLPTSRWRGRGVFRVITKMYRHPVAGYIHYGRTVITVKGLNAVSRKLRLAQHQPEGSRNRASWVN